LGNQCVSIGVFGNASGGVGVGFQEVGAGVGVTLWAVMSESVPPALWIVDGDEKIKKVSRKAAKVAKLQIS